MYLKSLRIQGFKTFARRTDLPFGRGITAIVGPNGSGKSNLVDAIRWALGERNARGLRGSRMEDVIYAGGPGKSPVGMAEVSLLIDNADQRINVEFTEIEVARRLFRSGESEYLINGTRARLKDIDALLASTGLRQDGYAVVAQNDIDYVIQAAPGLRRELIEEAAGVRPLREQRQEAVNRLAEAEKDMRRARDLLNELSPRAEELRTQAQAAEEYQRVANQLKLLQGSLAKDAWRKAKVQLRRAQTREHAARTRHEAAAAGLAAFDPLYAGHRSELMAARDARWTHQQRLAELRLRLAEAHHQVRIADERRAAAAQAIAAADREIGRLQDTARAGGQVVDELERAVASAHAELDEAQRHSQALNAQEASVREAGAALTLERTGIERQRQEMHRERLSLQAEIRQLEGRLQFVQEQRDTARAEWHGWTERKTALFEESRRDQLALEAAERTLVDANAALETVETQLAAATQAVAEAESGVRSLEDEVRAKEAEIGALRLLRERDQPSRPLSRRSDLHLRRLLEVITVAEEFQAAVEAVLSDWLSGWVADDQTTADEAVRLLRRDTSGDRESILFNPERGDVGALPQGARSLSAMVSVPPAIEPLVTALLDRVVIADDLPAARRLLESDPSLRVVTRAAELLTSFAYRAGRPRYAPLQVEARLREIDAGRGRAEHALQEAQRSLATMIAARVALVDERAAAMARRDVTRTEHARASTIASAAALSIDRELQVGRRLEERAARLDGVLLEQAGELAAALERHEEAIRVEAGLDRAIFNVDERLHQSALAMTSCQQRRQEAELEAALAMQRREDLLRQLARAREAWRSQADDLAQRRAAAGDLVSQPALIDREREKWTAEAERSTAELGQLDSAQLPNAESVQALEEQVHQDEQRNVALRVDLAHADDGVAAATAEVETAQAEVDRCAAALRDEGHTVQDEEPVEEVDWQKTEREVLRLQRRLESMGAVNLLAPGEYAQLRDRCESLATQLTDLEGAAAQLLELRQRLEDEIDQRFRTVFQSVAVNFQEFFTELFEGGRATLRLEAPADGNPLDDGVEILAQTPGKRLQPLTLLSGGERALTALAFLFALQAVNPSPFYVLDEVDAALDDANVVRFNRVLRRLANGQQFLIVTHNHSTMAQSEVLYGVTLAGHGISRIVSVRLERDAAAIPRIAERTA